MRIGRHFFVFVLSVALSACAPTPVKVSINSPVVLSPSQDVDEAIVRLSGLQVTVHSQALLDPDKVQLPLPGAQNELGVGVSRNMYQAYQAYLTGDIESGLKMVNLELSGQVGELETWYLLCMKMQLLIAGGRAFDVGETYELAKKLEQTLFGKTLFIDALLGQAYVWMGQYEDAKQAVYPVVAATQEWTLPVRYSPPPSNANELTYVTTAQSRAYGVLASAYMLEGNYEQAYYWSTRAEANYARLHFVANHFSYGKYFKAYAESYHARASNLSLMAALTAIRNGKPDALSDQLFSQIDQFYRTLGYEPGRLNNEMFQAFAYYTIEYWHEALEKAREVVRLSQQLRQFDVLWRVQSLVGEATLKLGDKAAAVRAFLSAQAAVDLVNGSLASDRSKRKFGLDKRLITHRLVHLNLDFGHIAEAFDAAERGRARAFIDLLRDTQLGFNDNQATNQAIRLLDQQIALQRLKFSLADLQQIESIKQQEQDLVGQRVQLVKELADQNPEWAAAYAVRAAPLFDVQSTLKPNEMMLYYLPMQENENIAWLRIANDEVVLEYSVSQDLIQDQLQAFGDAIAFGDVVRQKEILSQFKENLKLNDPAFSKQRVFVVADGLLNWMPWSGVLDGAYSVLPNATWLVNARQIPKRSKPSGALIIGNPDFGGQLPALPGAEKEALLIANRYKVKPVVGKSATIDFLQSSAKDRLGLLHLATHGRFNTDEPLQSAIYLSDGKGRASELTAQQIFENPLRARAVVLSACESGLGKTLPDNDILGLQRSFFLNGAELVLSSLWPVSDSGTQYLMDRLHPALLEDSDQALAKVVQTLKAEGKPPSVYASFVLTGFVPVSR